MARAASLLIHFKVQLDANSSLAKIEILNCRNAVAKIEHICGGSADTKEGDENMEEADCSSRKGNSVEEELNMFLGEASSTDSSKVIKEGYHITLMA